MKILKNFTILFFLSAMLFFTACKKHYMAPPNQGHGADAKLIKVGNELNSNQFEYDAATAQIAKFTVVTDSVPTAYSITYQNGVPALIQSSYSLTKFTYADGHLVRSEVYYNNSPQVQSMILFNYAGNTLSEQLFYEKPVYSATLQPQLKYKFETLPNGDISTVEIFLWDSTTGAYNYSGTDRYSYDDHANPIYPTRDLRIFYALPPTPRNIKTITGYDASGTMINLLTYDYTYNNAGNPVEAVRTQTPTGGFSSVSRIVYTYQ